MCCHLALELARRARRHAERPILLADLDGNSGALQFLIKAPYPGLDVACPRFQTSGFLESARTQYEWAVMDLGRSFNAFTLAVLEHVDELYLVTTPDVMALHQTRRIAQAVFDSHYSRGRVRLVLNRLWKGADEKISGAVAKMSGLRVCATLPSDYRAHYEAALRGELLSPRSGFAKHIARLADQITGIAEKEPRPALSLFGGLAELTGSSP